MSSTPAQTAPQSDPQPFYTKCVMGHVEQTFDTEGNCLDQKFVPHETDPVDRRIIRAEGEEIGEGELEDDEIITHAEDIKYILSREKFVEYDMMPVRRVL